MPLPRPLPKLPRFTTAPLVMYSQPKSPTPSTTAVAPELRTANRSPASPSTNSRPPVAPNSAKLPISTLPPGAASTAARACARRWCRRTWPLPTPSLAVPVWVMVMPSLQNSAVRLARRAVRGDVARVPSARKRRPRSSVYAAAASTPLVVEHPLDVDGQLAADDLLLLRDVPSAPSSTRRRAGQGCADLVEEGVVDRVVGLQVDGLVDDLLRQLRQHRAQVERRRRCDGWSSSCSRSVRPRASRSDAQAERRRGSRGPRGRC